MLLLVTLFWCWPAGDLQATPPSGYYLVWADEFNSYSLDTTKWANRWPGARRDAINSATAVSVNGSNLVITTYTSNGVHYTGMIATADKFHLPWGYLEASIDYNDTNGMWSAFWLQSPTMGSYIGDPAYAGTEIDVCEHRKVDSGGANLDNQVVINIHWDGYTTGVHKSTGSGPKGSGLANGFHTYAMKWTPASYAFFIDNVQQWSTTSAVSGRSEYILLSSEVESNSWAGTPPASGFGALSNSTVRMLTDYVRYYAPTTTVFWDGSSSGSWTNAANWVANMGPKAGNDIVFSYLSTANRTTTLDQDYAVNSLTIMETPGSVTIGGNNNTLTIGAGGLNLIAAKNNTTINSRVNLGASQSWQVGSGRTLTFNNTVSGTGALNIDGYGTNVFTVSNNFSGTTRLVRGALKFTHPYALYGTTLDMATTNDTGLLIPASLFLGGLVGSRDLDLGAYSLSVGHNNQSTSFSGSLKASGPLTKAGTGTLTISGSNYLGNSITVSGGTLGVAGIYALGSSPFAVTVNSGAQLNLNGTGLGAGPIRKNLGLYGNGNGVYASPLRVGGGSTPPIVWAGTITLLSDASIQLDGSRTLTLSNTVNAITSGVGADLLLAGDGGSFGEIIGPISIGAGTLTKSGGGTWQLSGANTYAGDTRVTAGVLNVNHANALQNSTLDMNAADSGILNLNNFNAVLGGLRSSRNLALGSGAVAIGNNNQDTAFAGVLSGSGSVKKVGSGTLRLSGANTYAGDTVVQSGTLLVNSGSVSGTGTGTVTVWAGATLGGAGSIPGAVALSGTLAPGDGIGTLATGPQTWSGGAAYVCEMTNALVTGGWDGITVNGPLTVAATPSARFVVRLVSRTVAGVLGPADAFNNQSDYAWPIATASGGVAGFDPAAFAVDASGFANSLAGGAFTVEQAGNAVVLKFHANTFPSRFTEFHLTSGGLQFSAVGVPGKSYDLVSAVNLVPPVSWVFVTNVTADINGALQFTNLPVAGSNAFYRLQASGL